MPHLFNTANVFAIAHTHSVIARSATHDEQNSIELPIIHQERMVFDGIDTLTLPVIEGGSDGDLEMAISKLLENNAELSAVLIKKHGLLVWGISWQIAIKK